MSSSISDFKHIDLYFRTQALCKLLYVAAEARRALDTVPIGADADLRIRT